ncbi:hypothetical protein G6F46_009678 [Rhizopus delemar]|uniref:Uncharacterized protein n=2 Tax=Rhizopus TaxID=4842 RepID=A0A9P6YS07_9FUNG|nr:hypothetical protein G6F36_014668 [Rhizopus arrhizus]KAG1446080.1 hypothetical protein G6F55_011692 [Rhizopus delemar]KAG1492604.1 hypothetical protein G6F54_009189 [Rhizopus delemar]KAG1506743.1 hypothetical protein G6F53_009470 [Rhizopus delemar]KAG1508739.1 hypothetical protein G6F52_011315 [Rhizopus delemar]
MEATGSTSMAGFSDHSRLPTSMESNTSPMEVHANEIHTRRTDGCERSSTEVSLFRDCRTVTFSRQKLPVELFAI